MGNYLTTSTYLTEWPTRSHCCDRANPNVGILVKGTFVDLDMRCNEPMCSGYVQVPFFPESVPTVPISCLVSWTEGHELPVFQSRNTTLAYQVDDK